MSGTKAIRTGVYGLIQLKDKVLVIKKGRGPFIGKYDLPGGKIEHGEENKIALVRELSEEVGLKPEDFIIGKLLTVEDTFVKHEWEGETKDEHIIAIVYAVRLQKENFNLDYIEKNGDAQGLKLIPISDTKYGKTDILQKLLSKFCNNK